MYVNVRNKNSIEFSSFELKSENSEIHDLAQRIHLLNKHRCGHHDFLIFFGSLSHSHAPNKSHIKRACITRYTHEFISVHMSKLQSTNHQDFFLWFCVIVIVLCNFRKSDIRTLNL